MLFLLLPLRLLRVPVQKFCFFNWKHLELHKHSVLLKSISFAKSEDFLAYVHVRLEYLQRAESLRSKGRISLADGSMQKLSTIIQRTRINREGNVDTILDFRLLKTRMNSYMRAREISNLIDQSDFDHHPERPLQNSVIFTLHDRYIQGQAFSSI